MYANTDKCNLLINANILLTLEIGEHEISNNLGQVN